MKNEYTTEEWEARGGKARAIRASHERGCTGQCGHVFRCRSRRPYACGRYVGACKGGADDNRCAACWVKTVRKLKRPLLSFIRKTDRVSEAELHYRFGAPSIVDEALYELFEAGKIEWFESSSGRRFTRVRSS